MSEKMNKALNFDPSQMRVEAEELLGYSRLEPLSLFSTEEYLQRSVDSFRMNPNQLSVAYSNISGGNFILDGHRATLEAQNYLQDTPDRVPKISALNIFFHLGYGLVERTIASHYISQADPEMTTPEAYTAWTEQPLEERVEEMKAYLHAQDADLLAQNLLESENEGSMAQFAKNLNVTVPRVTGEETYILNGNESAAASTELTEGTLAALYLLREHQIGQDMKDMDKDEAQKASDKPPETPPGHYLG
jgi:hypothetical protein